MTEDNEVTLAVPHKLFLYSFSNFYSMKMTCSFPFPEQSPYQNPKTLDKKTVHRQEQTRCGDLFNWFGGPLQKRFQGPVVCCLLPPPTSGMLFAVMAIKLVPIGSYRDKTSLLFYLLYSVGPGKILFVNLSSSTSSCTVFLYNVFDQNLASSKLAPSKLAPWLLAPMTTRPMTAGPWAARSMDSSPHGQLTTWTACPMDSSPHRQLTPWTARPMDNSPCGQLTPWWGCLVILMML